MTDADKPKRRPARRGMYILPSLFTAGSIAAGFYAIVQSLQGSPTEPHHFDHAALVIGLAIPFDGLDGRIARMTNTASDFGKELDSLADVITFGVAPSVLAYSWGFRMLPPTMDPLLRHKLMQIGAVVCFLFLICGACRLARFNTSADAKPKNPGRPDRKYFVGMPIPAAAGVIAACVHCFLGTPVFSVAAAGVWIGLVGLVGFLMVSTWRFWSGKEITLTGRHPFQLLVLIGAAVSVLLLFSQFLLLVIALGYMFSGLVARAAYTWTSRHRRIQKTDGTIPRPTIDHT
ncbi:MAG TPA: CDP-diacylglycerol--serine O-phosphatidyltransferase [Acidobacteriaceae bacterium]|nr:CDP-diacylglycerol--serine O-phosphatidyltransferase [Acidobacteriaceae bacterium]